MELSNRSAKRTRFQSLRVFQMDARIPVIILCGLLPTAKIHTSPSLQVHIFPHPVMIPLVSQWQFDKGWGGGGGG